MNITRITDSPELLPSAAAWFEAVWGSPAEGYRQSMEDAAADTGALPQWYLMLGEDHKIIGGCGVTAGELPGRKGLFPFLCALFIEQKHRGKGLSRMLLEYVCADRKRAGEECLYLITELSLYYERFGWSFLENTEGDLPQNLKIYERIL